MVQTGLQIVFLEIGLDLVKLTSVKEPYTTRKITIMINILVSTPKDNSILLIIIVHWAYLDFTTACAFSKQKSNLFVKMVSFTLGHIHMYPQNVSDLQFPYVMQIQQFVSPKAMNKFYTVHV